MTEKAKMLAGELYQPGEEQLKQERKRAKQLCQQLNQSAPDDQDLRSTILKQLLGKISTANVESNFLCDYGYNIELGDNFFANHNCIILDCAPVKIGDNVMFGPNVTLSSAGHPLDAPTRITGLEFAQPITIGDNVWLGANVTINPGVSIGDNVVIGSGSVVTRDIPANVVAAGVPCRVIRELEQAT
ncbi:MAG: sugar O-acetyltransferase [Endozoicomonas sp.]